MGEPWEILVDCVTCCNIRSCVFTAQSAGWTSQDSSYFTVNQLIVHWTWASCLFSPSLWQANIFPALVCFLVQLFSHPPHPYVKSMSCTKVHAIYFASYLDLWPMMSYIGCFEHKMQCTRYFAKNVTVSSQRYLEMLHIYVIDTSWLE